MEDNPYLPLSLITQQLIDITYSFQALNIHIRENSMCRGPQAPHKSDCSPPFASVSGTSTPKAVEDANSSTTDMANTSTEESQQDSDCLDNVFGASSGILVPWKAIAPPSSLEPSAWQCVLPRVIPAPSAAQRVQAPSPAIASTSRNPASGPRSGPAPFEENGDWYVVLRGKATGVTSDARQALRWIDGFDGAVVYRYNTKYLANEVFEAWCESDNIPIAKAI